MAHSLRLMALPRLLRGRPEEGPVWMMDPVEWLLPVTLEDNSERRALSPNHGYSDFILAITAAELAQWHARDRHRATEGVYSTEVWQKVLGPKVAELERLVSAADCPRFFMAHWYEWESGL